MEIPRCRSSSKRKVGNKNCEELILVIIGKSRLKVADRIMIEFGGLQITLKKILMYASIN